MKFVITLGDALELAFVALVVGALALGYAVEWLRKCKRKRRNEI